MGWLARAFGGARAPRDVDAALRSALLAVLARDLDHAEAMLACAVRLDSDQIDGYTALARLYRMRGEIGRAIQIHQNLLLRTDLAPDQKVGVLADLAADFQHGGFLRRAIAAFEEVLAADARHPQALRALARLFADVRDYPRAIEMSRRLARREGRGSAEEEAALLVEMAEAAQAEGRSADARRAVKRALRRNRKNPRAWLVLGTLEAERGRSKAALASWARVADLDRGSGPRVYPRIEATYASLGRPRDYEAYLRTCLAGCPGDPGARIALARSLAARGDVDDAVAELRRVCEGDPDGLDARGTLARILLSEQRDPDAAAVLAELLEVLERRGLLEGRKSLE